MSFSEITVLHASLPLVEKRAPVLRDSPRLSTRVTPSHYDVTLKPHTPFIKPHFDGDVTISIHTRRSSSVLRLNMKNLTLRNVTLHETEHGDVVQIDRIYEIAEYEQLVIYFTIPLRSSVNYTFHAEYRGEMVYPFDELGLYWDTYTEHGQMK